MAHNKLYRNFIILQEDENNHSTSEEKGLSGYAKIEAKSDKCKISFYAQNLKKEEKYILVLICYKKDVKQIVELGSLITSEVGKGEASKEYYINNIAGLDFSYEKISGAAICKQKDNGLNFLMYGFMNGENVDENWKKCKVVKNQSIPEVKKEAEKEKKTEKKLEIKSEEKKYEEKKYEDKKQKEEKCDECVYKPKKEEKQEHKEKAKDKECNIEKEHKTKDCKENCEYKREENKFDSYERMIDEKKEEDIDPDNFKIRGAIGDFFTDIVKGLEEVKNTSKEIKYCKWYKIKVGALDDMCNVSNYNKYTVAYYPMLNYYPYIKKYGYFMLGYKCDSKGNLKYIVYGVPGKKDKDEQPYAGKTGFVTWMSNKENKNEGCWLMFYDYKNSMVVVPMK